MNNSRLALHHKRELLDRVLLTSKGSWFQDPEYGLDYSLLYSDPSPVDVETEVKRALGSVRSISEIQSVSSTLMPPTNPKNAYRLLISMQIIFEDGEELVHILNAE